MSTRIIHSLMPIAAALAVATAAPPVHAEAVASVALNANGGQDGLVRFDSLGEFLAAGRSRGIELTHEDFEASMARFLDQNEFAGCIEPVNSQSDDGCFKPGGLAEGFSIRSSHLKGVLSQGTDILQVESMTIGAWPYQSSPSSLNYTRVEFDPAPTLIAADVYGFELSSGNVTGAAVPVLVEAFGLDGQSLGSYSVEPATANQPAFVGFSSQQPIAAVEFGTRVESAGEQIDNLYFGGGIGHPVPAHGRVDFGPVIVDAVGVQSVQVENQGSLPLSLDVPQITGGPFALEEEDCSQQELPAGATCSVWVSFQPDHRDDFRATLELPGDYPGAQARVRLRGTGVVVVGGVR